MKNNTTAWFIVGFLVLLVVGVVVAGIYSSGSSPSSTSAGFVATTAPPITSSDWTMGSATATVSLIEYGDFQCPACGEYYPIVKQLLSEYGNKIYFVFRNFPLYTIHPDAGIAAQAAEAAGLQGKYWEMHDLLYENQATWSAAAPADVVSQHFDGYASQLGLNANTFDADINSSAVLNKIQDDVNGGNAAQIDHTPTFFVNLRQIPNPTGLAGFEATINAALASSTAAQ